MRFSSRRSDADADVIRARLRALLEDRTAPGWVPEDDEPTSVPPAEPEDPALEDPALEGPARAEDARRSPAHRPDEREAPEPPGPPTGTGRHRAPGPAARWDPGREGARSLWLAALVAVLLLLGWTWSDRPRVEPAPADAGVAVPGGGPAEATPVGEAAGASSAVVVSVVGPVARPGLVTLPAGARVADAVQAAGGLLPEGDPASVNLAAPLTDGAQIVVGLPGGGPTAPLGAGTAGTGAAVGHATRLDLNTATAADLDGLPGIGPVLAQRIVDHRRRHGPFAAVDQLDDVPGIGPSTAAELAELVAV